MNDLLGAVWRSGYSHMFLNIGLGFVRLLALVSVAPFLGGRWVPVTARVVVAMALALACFPVLGATNIPVVTKAVVALLILKETIVGLAIGFAMALVFRAAEAAGDLIEAGRGMSMSEILNPVTREPSSPLGTMYGLLCVAVLFLTGGHLAAIEAIAGSFRIVPVTSLPTVSADMLFHRLLVMSASLLVLAAALAGPVLLAVVLADLAMGLVSRAAPELNAYFVALPLKAVFGLLVVTAGAALALNILHARIAAFIAFAAHLFNT
ncbi:MAG: flagellar biosynthetic protein FliR [Deltaproteobacteria bacterium]|nr:flagellar biosynthetic protein FliR [Deltaproteobacteria bacterium]